MPEFICSATCYIRLADEKNRETNLKGGTWYSNRAGLKIIKDWRKKHHNIGGDKEYKVDLVLKEPLILKEAHLQGGSWNVALKLLGKTLDKYGDIVVEISDAINAGERKIRKSKKGTQYIGAKGKELIIPISHIPNARRILMKGFKKARIPITRAKRILEVFNEMPIDATVDAIVSKGLAKVGYGSLVLEEGKAKHIFVLNNSDIKGGIDKVCIKKDKTI